MLRRCTSKSLLLIDEVSQLSNLSLFSRSMRWLTFYSFKFGKGTAPADGMALLASMIGSLVASPNPRLLVTTHFLELMEYGLLGEAASKVEFYKMDYIIPMDATVRSRFVGL